MHSHQAIMFTTFLSSLFASVAAATSEAMVTTLVEQVDRDVTQLPPLRSDADSYNAATTSSTTSSFSAPQLPMLPQMQEDHEREHRPPPQQQQQHSRRGNSRWHSLTSDERHELQRQVMLDALESRHEHEQLPYQSGFSSVQEMRSFYYFHAGIIEIAAKNAVNMVLSSAYVTRDHDRDEVSSKTDVATTTNTVEALDNHMANIRLLESGANEEMQGIEDVSYGYDKDDSIDEDDENYNNNNNNDDKDYALYQLVSNAIESKLKQVQNNLDELKLIKHANDDEVWEKKEGGGDFLSESLSSSSSMMMSMSINVEKRMEAAIVSSVDDNSCSITHPTNDNHDEQVQGDQNHQFIHSYLSTSFTNDEYEKINLRYNCPSHRNHHPLANRISLIDARKKWTRMQQHYWKLFDIDIQIDDSNTENSFHSYRARGNGPYNYKANPDLYVDLVPSSLSSSSETIDASTPTSTSSYNNTQRGLFATRDFQKGDVVYTQKKHALYFQDLSSWEMYLQILFDEYSLAQFETNDPPSHQENDVCLAIEWSFTKRISRPGRWLVMLVLDEGVYMRRMVGSTSQGTADTATASSAANAHIAEDINTNVNDDDDDDDDDEDDDDEWLEGNIALDDERSLDFKALRYINAGEEVIDAGIIVD